MQKHIDLFFAFFTSVGTTLFINPSVREPENVTRHVIFDKKYVKKKERERHLPGY